MQFPGCALAFLTETDKRGRGFPPPLCGKQKKICSAEKTVEKLHCRAYNDPYSQQMLAGNRAVHSCPAAHRRSNTLRGLKGETGTVSGWHSGEARARRGGRRCNAGRKPLQISQAKGQSRSGGIREDGRLIPSAPVSICRLRADLWGSVLFYTVRNPVGRGEDTETEREDSP